MKRLQVDFSEPLQRRVESKAAFFRMSRSSVTRLSSAFRRRSSSVWDTWTWRSDSGTAKSLIHLYRLCWLTPIRAETSATRWPRSVICLTASILNSSG